MVSTMELWQHSTSKKAVESNNKTKKKAVIADKQTCCAISDLIVSTNLIHANHQRTVARSRLEMAV